MCFTHQQLYEKLCADYYKKIIFVSNFSVQINDDEIQTHFIKIER